MTLQGHLGTTQIKSVGITINGDGSIATGLQGLIEVPFSGTIIEWLLIADAAGSIVMDVWKTNNAIPTNAKTITAAAKPTLTAQQKASSTTLTGWTVAVVDNDVFGFEIESVSGILQVTLQIVIRVAQ